MAQPLFASLESRLATGIVAAFDNIRLTDGARAFSAVMDRNVEFIGEHGLTSDRRTRITVTKSAAVGFASGLALTVDPATYTTNEILAMERSAWVLDRLAEDDGHTEIWWLKK